MCALLLHEALITRFGEDQIFMDVDSIDPGVDYVEAIQQALDACDVSLALIGPQWLTIGGDNGERRLNDPHDKVRQEIEAALARNIAVIPILVDGACMPPRNELPGRLKPLAHRNALELTHSHYAYVRDRLVEVVEQVLRSVTSPGSAPAAEGRPGAPDAPSPTRRPQLTGGAGFPRPGDAYAIHRVAGLAVGTAREMPDTVEKVWLFEELVRTLVMVGDNEKAAAVARDARLAAKRIDDDAKPPALIAAAKLLAWTGQADQAHNLIAAMPAFGVSSGIYGVPARSAMARGFAVAGDADRAVAMVDSLVGCDDERVETLADLAKILADSHRAAAAAGLAAKAVTIADRLRGNEYARRAPCASRRRDRRRCPC
jgi:TIR domain